MHFYYPLASRTSFSTLTSMEWPPRQVKCDAVKPACTACKKSASAQGRNPANVVCEYDTEETLTTRKTSRKSSGETPAHTERRPSINDSSRRPRSQDAVNGKSIRSLTLKNFFGASLGKCGILRTGFVHSRRIRRKRLPKRFFWPHYSFATHERVLLFEH